MRKRVAQEGDGRARTEEQTHCNTMRQTATRCNTLQHAATHCNMHTRESRYEANRARTNSCERRSFSSSCELLTPRTNSQGRHERARTRVRDMTPRTDSQEGCDFFICVT